ncbi:DUF4652 domain-containing protein [Clostridium sp. ZS2-4]|uniref:DUF4652 domain-containing protein n=1 Tax=Clostridium sp. ZS2-4 TaxID=2987703 RepID=UPI00227AF6D7|nr:DUF4652 domain-containing protein [Clostridium sp. ZS2-4]MCY6354673.1 DUF4652 domain-containing protein [Clostridium sp. ZS2-4]
MKCETFTDNLEKYILDDLCDDLKIKMEEHMKFCSHCRELYEEEMLFEQAIEESLNFEDVDFKSQKQKIMSKIDKDKYKKDIIIKTKVNPIKYIKWCAPIAAAAAFILMVNPIAKFKIESSPQKEIASVTENIDSKNSTLNSNNIPGNVTDAIPDKEGKDNKEGKETKEETYKKTEIKQDDKKQITSIPNNDSGKSTVNNDNSNESANNSEKLIPDIVSQDGENKKDIAMNIEDKNDLKDESLNIGVELEKISIEDNNRKVSAMMIEDNIWCNSPNEKLSYSTADKGKSDIIEENRDKIFIKDLKNNKKWLFRLSDNKNKVFIKYAKWIDDESLFVVSKMMKKNVVQHEELYMVNTITGKGLMVYKTGNSKRSIVDVEKNDENHIQVKLNTKNNDNSSETYLEKHTIYNVQNDIIDNDKKK